MAGGPTKECPGMPGEICECPERFVNARESGKNARSEIMLVISEKIIVRIKV